MSGRGRCVCGYAGSSCSVSKHQIGCPQYAEAFRGGYDLTPAEEYAKWAEGGRQEARAAAHRESVDDTDRRREAMAKRFATVDILED